MSSETPLTDEQLRAIYAWIDAVPLSRPKRNIARDFSDGCMLAELIAAYFPHLVEVHNYPAANSVKQKVYNHETLNKRVLKKFGYVIPPKTIDDIVNCRAGAIEGVLNVLQFKMAKFREKGKADSPGPSEKAAGRPEPHHQAPSHHSHNAEPVRGGGAQHSEPARGVNKAPANRAVQSNVVESEILIEKEQQIRELQETVEILELKIAKLEQLVRLKDNKIQSLLNKNH